MRQDGGKGGRGLPSPADSDAGSGARGTGAEPGRPWRREFRLLKRSEFEKVYSEGRRYSTPFFTAFLYKTDSEGSRVGFTAPRALGRNRVRRRLREAVRLHYPEIGSGWDIVFNPRRAVLDATFDSLQADVLKLFRSVREGKLR